MTTKIPAELSSTPSIVDNGNATAMTIDTNENLGLASRISVGTTTVGGGNTRAVVTGGMDNYIQLVSTTGNGGISIGNHAGGIMLFYSHTGALGSESYTQNLRLDTDGLKFGTDSAAANALNDYEYGTWTPAFQGASGIAYSEQTGYYIKIGDQVTLSFRMNVTTAPTSGSNIYIIMPYNPKGTGTGVAGTRWSLCTGTTLSDSVAALTGIANYASVANFYQYNSKNGSGYFNYTHFGTGLYSATLTYRID